MAARSPRIGMLLVEDNPDDAELLKEFVRRTGYQVNVMVAEDGQRAIDILNQVYRQSMPEPDVILLDVNVPKKSGHAVLEEIRDRGGKSRAIVYSGSKSPEDVTKAKASGADGYLVKPMTSDEISKLISELKSIFQSLGSTPE